MPRPPWLRYYLNCRCCDEWATWAIVKFCCDTNPHHDCIAVAGGRRSSYGRLWLCKPKPEQGIKNVDNDYLYDEEPEIPISSEFYNFPNIKDRIEKRYNYDVNINFYKKILDKEIYDKISDLETKKQLKKGDIFKTKEGTAIVYIGNNHKWFHVPKKLYDIFMGLKGQEVEIVGGSSEECLLDVVTTGKSMGVIMKTNFKFVWSASHCPIK